MSSILNAINAKSGLLAITAGIVGYTVKTLTSWWTTRRDRRHADQRHFRDKRLEYVAEFLDAIRCFTLVDRTASIRKQMGGTELTSAEGAEFRSQWQRAEMALQVIRILSPTLFPYGERWMHAMKAHGPAYQYRTKEEEKTFTVKAREALGEVELSTCLPSWRRHRRRRREASEGN